MTHINLFLALASLALLAVVAIQDYLVKPLRQESISSGLTGPYHWLLDAAFVVLAAAIGLAFQHGTVVQQVLAYGASGSLVLTGASGTFTTSLGAAGEKSHTILTAITFSLALALQLVSDHSMGLWGVTALGIASAITTHFLVANASVTEKVGVLGLCLWLVAWAL